MSPRMHPEDLRALVAAHLHAGTYQLVQGIQWQFTGHPEDMVREADALLAELARTAKPEPIDQDLERRAQAVMEAAGIVSPLERLTARAEAAEKDRDEARDAARQLGAQAKEALARLAAIDAAREGEPPMPKVEHDPDVPVSYREWGKQAIDWGRQGWDAAAALRVELDTMWEKDHTEAFGRGARAEREQFSARLTKLLPISASEILRRLELPEVPDGRA